MEKEKKNPLKQRHEEVPPMYKDLQNETEGKRFEGKMEID